MKKIQLEVLLKGTISSSNDYAIYVKLEGYDIDAFLHCNDLQLYKRSRD